MKDFCCIYSKIASGPPAPALTSSLTHRVLGTEWKKPRDHTKTCNLRTCGPPLDKRSSSWEFYRDAKLHLIRLAKELMRWCD